MKKLLFALCLSLSARVYAWNPITDVRDNVVWTFGKTAEVGEAVKIAGGGDLANGETTTSVLAGIADYRWFCLSYGGTRVNHTDQNFTDTAKVGIRLNAFFNWFKNPTTPEMEFLKNLNVGPSYSMSLFSSPHVGTLFLDINYRFGSAPAPVSAP